MPKPTRAQKIRLGIFVITGSLALIALIAYFTSENYLRNTDIYYIAYKDASVSGLEEGSPVKYLGVKVGSIKDIHIDPKDVSRVIIKVALQPGTPVKKDARADIASVGITGLKMIEIRGGSNEAELLDEGGYIAAGSSSIAEEITGRAEVITNKIERILNNLQGFTQPENLENFTLLAERATAVLEKIDTHLAQNGESIQQTMARTEAIASQLDSASHLMHHSFKKINSMIYSDTLHQILASTRDISLKLKEANFTQLIQELGEVVERTNRLLLQLDHDVERGSVDFLTSMDELKNTLENLKQTSRQIQEDPSILIRGASYENAPDHHLTDRN